MSLSKINAHVMYVSAVMNLILVVLLWGTLRVAPSDVLAEVQSLHASSLARSEKVKERIDEVVEELDLRSEWMHSIDTELAARTKDRIYRRQFIEWRAQVQKLNPDLKLPELPDDSRPVHQTP